MSVSSPQSPQTPLWDPQQGDLALQHGVYPSQSGPGQPAQYPPETSPQELISAGWTPCPRCKQFWISPENKAQIENSGGYFTCPKCKMTSDLLSHLPWHGVEEPDYYPRQGSGGGTHVGLPMEDVAQIAENVVQGMKEIPGYGPITWWHPGPAAGPAGQSSLDGATAEWGIEVKGQVYDSAGHFWDPRNGRDPEAPMRKAEAAGEMGLKGILGVFVLENFRTDTADVYVKEMPLDPWSTSSGITKAGLVKWHKRTGVKVATGIRFTSPYKDPNNPAPGPYSLSNFYEKPRPMNYQPPEQAPF